jgi:tRNA (guanine37-N1)-methyltransferase
MITFRIVSLFPESLASYLDASIVSRAQKKRFIAIRYYNPRDFAVAGKKGREMTHAERRIDNRPYGGGPGMVIEAMPVIRAIERAIGKKLDGNKKGKIKIIFFTPSGKRFTNKIAETFKKYTDIVLVCGRYEGIDARVKKVFPITDVSVGPYTLTGGELPAMVIIDAITRRIPGVLGDDLSVEESRIANPNVYTRPEVIKYEKNTYKVPKILLSGHHKKIEDWKISKNRKN